MTGPLLWMYDHSAIVLAAAALAAAVTLAVFFYGDGPDVR